MSLVAQLSALATRIGTEIKGLIRSDHPGLARAWVNFGFETGAMRLRAAHNVESVTRLGTGRYRINFASPFADSAYCWVATARSASTSTLRVAATRASDGKTPTSLELVCSSSSGSLADSTEINLVVYR